MAGIEAFIIHLERATARAPQVAALRAALPVPAGVLPAVDAAGAAAGEMARYRPEGLHRPRYPFALTPVEVAVFLSHRTAWAEIVARGLDAGLIVEDDVALDPAQFGAAWALAAAEITPDRLIRLPQKDRERAGDRIAEAAGVRLVRPVLPGLGMQATLVGRAAAARLLAVSERFDRPVDTLIQMPWVTGVETLSVWPAGVRDISAELGGSTLKRRRGVAERIRAEIARALYRAAIRRRARAG